MTATMTYREALKLSMRDAMVSDPGCLIYGLGVTDFTGIFGTTLGLEKEFGPGRVFDTPLSEDAMTGLAVGAALNGLYPIHIHIRNDFTLLTMNQVVNSIAKYRYMYGGLFQLPLLIRSVVGRSWGQGAQHSQSLQALFAHVPGLTVVMPASAASVLDTYAHAVKKFKGPVISLEHRLLYDYSFNLPDAPPPADPFAPRLARAGRDVTVVAVSSMVIDALHAADYMSREAGIEAEVIDLHCLTARDLGLVLSSVRKTGRLLVADTGWASYGVCAEICRAVAVSDPGVLKAPVAEAAPAHAPCPTAKALENSFYPDMGTVVDKCYSLALGPGHGRPLPSEEFKRKLRKEFKGPF